MFVGFGYAMLRKVICRMRTSMKFTYNNTKGTVDRGAFTRWYGISCYNYRYFLNGVFQWMVGDDADERLQKEITRSKNDNLFDVGRSCTQFVELNDLDTLKGNNVQFVVTKLEN